MILVHQPVALDNSSVPIAELKVRLRELVRMRDNHHALNRGYKYDNGVKGPIDHMIESLVQQVSKLEPRVGAM